MEVVHERCAGLDVHKESVVACVRMAGPKEAALEHTTFGTTTGELFKLADWLVERGVTAVVMEATGVYWRPVWRVLSLTGLELTLGNAADVRNVPGRKTDVNDATWLAELHAHGLVRASFVPPAEQAELRDLMRTHKQLVRERSAHVQRVQKVLEDANIKLSGVLSDVMGKSGRAIVEALANGTTDPEKLAELAVGKARQKRGQLVEALRGYVDRRHRFLLTLHLAQIDQLDKSISDIEKEAERYLAPFEGQVELLKTIAGVGKTVAEVVAAEVGLDMTRFPTAAHLRSWARVCPGANMSAGKQRSTCIRKGCNWLKTALIQAANAASRTKDTALAAMYRRIKARRGHGKAIVAVAAQILTIAYAMLRTGKPYAEPEPPRLSPRTRTRVVKQLTGRLAELGYQVQLQVIT